MAGPACSIPITGRLPWRSTGARLKLCAHSVWRRLCGVTMGNIVGCWSRGTPAVSRRPQLRRVCRLPGRNHRRPPAPRDSSQGRPDSLPLRSALSAHRLALTATSTSRPPRASCATAGRWISWRTPRSDRGRIRARWRVAMESTACRVFTREPDGAVRCRRRPPEDIPPDGSAGRYQNRDFRALVYRCPDLPGNYGSRSKVRSKLLWKRRSCLRSRHPGNRECAAVRSWARCASETPADGLRFRAACNPAPNSCGSWRPTSCTRKRRRVTPSGCTFSKSSFFRFHAARVMVGMMELTVWR